MRVLLTGGSSFTGLWFAKALHDAGHEVVAPIRGMRSSYEGGRAKRVAELAKVADIRDSMSFGDEAFLALTGRESFDILAHHAADVSNYRSLDFDVPGAVANNSLSACAVIDAMQANGLKAVVVTGSVFECDAGSGDGTREAFSPYGLSKALTYQVFRFWTRRAGVRLGKFNIANPFGVFEEPRFCNFLIRTWAKNEKAKVNTPLYLRDNIFVELLASHYAAFVQEMAESPVDQERGPMGFAESQGAFAQRFGAAMRPRLKLDCGLELGEQTSFDEPLVRLNTDRLPTPEGWSDEAAWDRLAEYYLATLAAG